MTSEAPGIVKPIEILLVEDSPHYARLIQETFHNVNAHAHFHIANDGLEAMAFLKRNGKANADAPRPDLILLDLGMPKMDGRQVLAWLKQDRDLRTIPTLILTTSEIQGDIDSSYENHANSYLQKPVELGQLDALLKSINDFWFNHSTPPNQPQR
ncbi:MAG: response regulator [Candidatus Sulfotelmatobacter sp.]|jgi:two-component system, chemotaxis family, response regulator Rcp1